MPRRGKFNNKPVYTKEGKFDSEGEYNRWIELKLLEKAKEISKLERQIPIELIPQVGKQRPITWIADFIYYQNGQEVREDFKGFRTEVFNIKKKLHYWRYGFHIKLTYNKKKRKNELF